RLDCQGSPGRICVSAPWRLRSMTRLSSGSSRIDQIPGGGLPDNGITLVMGPPGSGKTILCEQYVFHNATTERPALYLSTVSAPLPKILRHGPSLHSLH